MRQREIDRIPKLVELYITRHAMSELIQGTTSVSISSESVFHINKDQLPLHCPLPEMSLWNQHPRVFLPIEGTGKSKCPYCSTEFVLEK